MGTGGTGSGRLVVYGRHLRPIGAMNFLFLLLSLFARRPFGCLLRLSSAVPPGGLGGPLFFLSSAPGVLSHYAWQLHTLGICTICVCTVPFIRVLFFISGM